MLELECTVRNIQESVGYKVEVNTHHPSTRNNACNALYMSFNSVVSNNI